ncbi:MAG: hypothetical protein AAGG01_07820 [Planctomycetota bacterium]
MTLPIALAASLGLLSSTPWLAPQTSSAADTARSKSQLRVLFVGNDPAAPDVLFADMANERTVELYKERTPAFEAFLTERFESVRVVYGGDYVASLSDGFDVTIFDTRPKALKEAVRGVDPETGESIYEPAAYLPESFTRPAITIAANSPQIGEPLGLKLDWL